MKYHNFEDAKERAKRLSEIKSGFNFTVVENTDSENDNPFSVVMGYAKDNYNSHLAEFMDGKEKQIEYETPQIAKDHLYYFKFFSTGEYRTFENDKDETVICPICGIVRDSLSCSYDWAYILDYKTQPGFGFAPRLTEMETHHLPHKTMIPLCVSRAQCQERAHKKELKNRHNKQ